MDDRLLKRLDELETRLARLEDEAAIRLILAAYGPAVDSGNSRKAAQLWADDGVYDLGDLGVHTGHDAIAALFDSATHNDLIDHGAAHILNPSQIMIDGDEAVATGYSIVARYQDGQFILFRVAANRWELRKNKGKWLVTHRTNQLLNGQDAARLLLGSAG